METATACLQECRGGRNVQHQLVPLMRQSLYSCLAVRYHSVQCKWHGICLGLLVTCVVTAGACGMPMGPGMMMSDVEPRPSVIPAPTATPGGPATVSFLNDVRPILIGNCVQCHGGQGGLYVDSYDTLVAGSSRNKVVVPGNPEESILIQRLTGELRPRMPLIGQPLSEREIAVIETWIREGTPNN